jgi:hypothetical protein
MQTHFLASEIAPTSSEGRLLGFVFQKVIGFYGFISLLSD